MYDDHFPVPGQADVELYAVGPHLQGTSKGLERVLGGYAAATAVSDD
jgi:hypothetical protein